MNRSELVIAAARRAGTTPESVRSVVDAIFGDAAVAGLILEALERGERVQLSGFGTFEARRRAARVARNPHTREPIAIPAAVGAAFRPGSGMRSRMRSAPLRDDAPGR